MHYLYLRLKDTSPTKWSEFTLSYDDMCNVGKMLIARQKLPLEAPYDRLWLEVNKVIDLLHIRNHIDLKCKEILNPNKLKQLYPQLNAPVAEHTFIWALRFKKILGAMPKSHFLFFYHRMVIRRNRYTEKWYKANTIPVLPKLRSVKSS